MKMLKLVILLSLLSLATSSSSESFFSSLQNLHNNLKLLPKQLESVHLEYQLQSNTLTPLQLFEKVYNVKIDKKSIEKVGGAKDEVLDLIRKIRKSDSSEEEQNEVLEALGKMEGTRGDVRKVLEEKAEKWKEKVGKNGFPERIEKIEFYMDRLKTKKTELETAVTKALATSTVDDSLDKLSNHFSTCGTTLRIASSSIAHSMKYLEPEDTIKKFENEIGYIDSKLDGFQKNLKSDYENLELIRNSEAGEEMKMVSEVIAKFNEDYANLQLNGYVEDVPKMELLKEFRSKTNDIYLRNRGGFEDMVKLSDSLKQSKSLEGNWTHIDEVLRCLKTFPPSLISFADEKRIIEEAKKALADSPGITETNQKMLSIYTKFEKISSQFWSDCYDAKRSNNLDNLKSSWEKADKIAQLVLDTDTREFLEKIRAIYKTREVFSKFVESSTFESVMELLNCFANLKSTIPTLKQSINNFKLFNSPENLKIMEKSVKTLDSLRDLHKLIEDFEAQKLTDRTEKLPEILEPIDKINTLKTGIDAIGSVLNAHRISKNMLRDSDVFEKFPDSDSYKSSESRIREFFSRFVPTTSSVISTISAVPDAPEFRISPEFVKFATENTVVDVETLMDFEKNWTDLRGKIEKMGGVLKEFEVWVRDGPVIGTTQGTTLAPRGRYGEVSCDCEMIDIDNSCDGFCDIDWEI